MIEGQQGLDSPLVVTLRTCIGCREQHPKCELLRVVARFDEADARWVAQPDPKATAPGRGAHLHPTPACYQLAKRRRAFDRALRHDARARGGALDLAVLDQQFAQ